MSEPKAPKFKVPKYDVQIYFKDIIVPQRIDNCQQIDRGWAIEFYSKEESWAISKDRIERIRSRRNTDDINQND